MGRLDNLLSLPTRGACAINLGWTTHPNTKRVGGHIRVGVQSPVANGAV